MAPDELRFHKLGVFRRVRGFSVCHAETAGGQRVLGEVVPAGGGCRGGGGRGPGVLRLPGRSDQSRAAVPDSTRNVR